VLEGLRGEYSIAELCRREGIAESLYYSWSKEFLCPASALLRQFG
jgi:transposase